MNKKEINRLEIDLNELYTNLKNGLPLNLAFEILNNLKINDVCHSLAYGSIRDFDRVLNLLVETFKIFYEEGYPYISDEIYDILYEKNNNLNGENAGCVIRETVGNKKIVNHNYPDLRGTIQKVHYPTKQLRGDDSRKSYEDWLVSSLKIIDDVKHVGVFQIKTEPKFDGVSVIFECEDNIAVRALTRGDTKKNEAVLITTLSTVGLDFSYANDNNYKTFGVKTEIIMTDVQFEKYKEKYGEFNSPRSAVSSAINSNEFSVDMMNYITIVPLQVQDYDTKEIIEPTFLYENYPMHVVGYDISDNVDDFNIMVYDIKDRICSMGIPIDGVVMKVVDPDIQKILGRHENINRYEVAYKFPPKSIKTVLKSVEFPSGLFGNITPVAHFEPVKINGNKVKQASLGSIDRFNDLKLHVGDEIVIKYDIIPYVDVTKECVINTDKPLIPVPTECLLCGCELIKDPQLKCVNVNCEGLILGKIYNFVKRVKLNDISEATINKLYSNKIIRNIEDLYSLESRAKDILNIDGFGEKKFSSMVNTINERVNMKDYEVLSSLGIESIGDRMFKKITNIYYINEIIDICINKEVDTLIKINGIGKEASRKIIEGITSNINLLNFLIDRFNITNSKDVGGTGTVITFSKIRDKDMEHHLEVLGHTVVDKYSKDVGVLIIPNYDLSSSKIDKAKKNNCKILSYDDACEYFNYKK